MEKLKLEQFSPAAGDAECVSPGPDTSLSSPAEEDEGELQEKQEGTTTTSSITTITTGPTPLLLLLDGVVKETVNGGTRPKQEVAVIELATRGGIKGAELEADISHTVQTTELRRPPISLPLTPRDPTTEAKRMVQLSPVAFHTLPARAMLYNNMVQPLATLNR